MHWWLLAAGAANLILSGLAIWTCESMTAHVSRQVAAVTGLLARQQQSDDEIRETLRAIERKLTRGDG